MAKTVKCKVARYRAQVTGITPDGAVETREYEIPACRSDNAALEHVRRIDDGFSPARVESRGVTYDVYEISLDEFLKHARPVKEGF